MKHELILEQLKIMGFDPVCIDDEKYLFEYKEMKFILTNDSDNEDFLSISIPWVYELTEENKMSVYETANLINTLVRYVKLTIHDEYISMVFEHRLAENEDLEDLLENIIHALSASLSVFLKKMKGEKIPYLDYNPEEDDDETDDSTDGSDIELESELEKLLENIDD